MERTALKGELIALLSQTQAEGGLECPPLTGTTKPAEDLPEFDSQIWPVVTTLLQTQIGATIPNEVNIFVGKGKLPRSIDEIAIFVCQLLEKQAKQDAA